MQTKENKSLQEMEIEARLRFIGHYLDIDALLNRKTDNQAVEQYYRKSDYFYDKVHNRGGDSIHLGLSDDDFYHKDDFLNQARFVAGLLDRPSMQVLELGAGKLINTKFLAKQFPNHAFTALDLPDRHFLKNRVPGNVTLKEGDYNDLSAFPEASFDLVFAVETLCYAESKKHVFGQIARVLKPGGKLVVFDGYNARPEEAMTESERRAAAVTWTAMCVTPRDQFSGDRIKDLKELSFTDVEMTDLTEKVRPTLRRLDRICGYFFMHPRFVKFARKHLPYDAVMNSIAGWLMLYTYTPDDRRILEYCRIVATKGTPTGDETISK